MSPTADRQYRICKGTQFGIDLSGIVCPGDPSPTRMHLPQENRSIVLIKSLRNSPSIYHDAKLETGKLNHNLRPDEILVKVSAVAFNHRDLWIRKGQYPGINFGSVLGSDAVGTVVGSGTDGDQLLNKRVFLVPMRGWTSSPDAPESRFGILGGGSFPSLGVFSDFVAVERDQVIVAPDHLEDHHAAAWPLAGVTAWRAVSVAANIQKGDSVLITGIGGGVALLAMQFCLAKGATVYVTSGSDDKISKAVGLGARSGVNYKSENWSTVLAGILETDKRELAVIIDSGGGDLFKKAGNLLKTGGKLVCYGMTAQPKITFTMREVLKNQKLIGSTMGSQQDLIKATEFITIHNIKPIVSNILDGLEEFEKGFELMERGDQFGKIVMKLRASSNSAESRL
ncbi:hypothetical protein M0805_008976 [Coniferiporia weirii]|nr:hypothetical protein M0805_008976 [Coniferiporia weirii]